MEIRKTKLEQLPLVDDRPDDLNRKAALAALFILRTQNPNLFNATQQQICGSQVDILGQIAEHKERDGSYRLSEAAVRGIVAQCVINGAIQTAVDIGTALQEISRLNHQVELGDLDQFDTDNTDNA